MRQLQTHKAKHEANCNFLQLLRLVLARRNKNPTKTAALWQNFLNRFLPSDKVFLFLLLLFFFSFFFSMCTTIIATHKRLLLKIILYISHTFLPLPLRLHTWQIQSKLQKLIFICAASWLCALCVRFSCLDKVYLTLVCMLWGCVYVGGCVWVECCKRTIERENLNWHGE